METLEDKASSGSNISRRSLLRVIGLGAAATAASAVIAGCGGSNNSSNTSSDETILNAALTAEGLAATLYANMISSPLFSQLNATQQGYLEAAYAQEVEHYAFLVTAGATALASTTVFYFPSGTFGSGQSNNQVTFNTLEIIEDLQIATYLLGIDNFSTTANKLYGGQILGVDSEHRVLGRVIANAIGLPNTANLSSFSAEQLGTGDPANNYDFERQFPTTLNNGITTVNTILTTNFMTLGTAGNSQTAYTLAYPAVSTVPAITSDNPIETD
jgi:hypothetical protein